MVAVFGVVAVAFMLILFVYFVSFMVFMASLMSRRGADNSVRYKDDWYDSTLEYSVVHGDVRLDVAD